MVPVCTAVSHGDDAADANVGTDAADVADDVADDADGTGADKETDIFSDSRVDLITRTGKLIIGKLSEFIGMIPINLSEFIGLKTAI